MGASPVRIDRPGDVLIASAPLTIEADEVVIPPDTTVWWSL
jgi:alpha-glucosidase